MMKASATLVRGVIACAALLASTASLPAQGFGPSSAYFDNLLQAPTSTNVIDSSSFFAQSFLTDASAADFTLDSVTLSMNTAAGSPNGSFLVDIYTDIAGSPGASIQSLSGNHSPLTAGDYPYDAVSVTLQPSTTYWIVARGLNGLGAYGWNYADSSTHTGGWSAANLKYSTDGSSWLDGGGGTQMMSIAATPNGVPEPSAWATIAGLSALGVVALRCRRKA